MDEAYAATCNSDRTEGRGFNRVIGIFTKVEDAVEAVQGMGVMGVGHGTVYAITLNSAENNRERFLNEDRKVYGYRKRLDGRWDYGYLDLRDLTADPEYGEYLRLKEKFE